MITSRCCSSDRLLCHRPDRRAEQRFGAPESFFASTMTRRIRCWKLTIFKTLVMTSRRYHQIGLKEPKTHSSVVAVGVDCRTDMAGQCVHRIRLLQKTGHTGIAEPA